MAQIWLCSRCKHGKLAENTPSLLAALCFNQYSILKTCRTTYLKGQVHLDLMGLFHHPGQGSGKQTTETSSTVAYIQLEF